MLVRKTAQGVPSAANPGTIKFMSMTACSVTVATEPALPKLTIFFCGLSKFQVPPEVTFCR